MAKNTDHGYRVGSVRDRSQTYNPQTEQYVKRDDGNAVSRHKKMEHVG